MRMHGQRDVFRGGAHLDGEHRFGDQFARTCAADTHAQHASVSGSMSIFVMPSVRSNDMARPDAAHGNLETSYLMPRSLASPSVRPHQASSGSVKTTAGMTVFWNVLFRR